MTDAADDFDAFKHSKLKRKSRPPTRTLYDHLPKWKQPIVRFRDVIQNCIMFFPVRRKYRKLLDHAKPRSRSGSR